MVRAVLGGAIGGSSMRCFADVVLSEIKYRKEIGAVLGTLIYGALGFVTGKSVSSLTGERSEWRNLSSGKKFIFSILDSFLDFWNGIDLSGRPRKRMQ
jgi:hypothetical protein